MKLVLQWRCSGISIGRGTFVDINDHDMLLISLVKFVQELLAVVPLMGTGKLGYLLPILTIVLGTRALVDRLMAIEGAQTVTSCWG
jgi:hypothetical protein